VLLYESVKRKCHKQLNCRIWCSEFVFSVILSGLIVKCLIGNFGFVCQNFQRIDRNGRKGALFSMISKIGCVCRHKDFFFHANGVAGFYGLKFVFSIITNEITIQ
jgi:hypothetical protein